MRIRVSADHFATGRIKLKIGAGAGADLQNCELPARLVELGETAKQLLLLVVHVLVVMYRSPVQNNWKDTFVYVVQARRLQQVEGKAQDIDDQSTTCL